MEAIEVANYLIAKSDNVGDPITNKKLQKLLYFVKAWGLAYFEDGVIDDSFEAWVHGPVCPIVYQKFKSFGYQPLSIEYNGKSSSEFIEDFKTRHHDEADKIELIDAVFNKYGILSSLQLEMLSHRSQPWIDARGNRGPIEKSNEIISDQAIKSHYSALVNNK